jgi:hypothetical protein
MDEMYPINFQRRLLSKPKRIILELANGVVEELDVPNYLENIYGNDWTRADLDLDNHPQILSEEDKEYLNTFVRKRATKIRAGEFLPKLRGGIMGAKMCSLVPQKSIMLRHVTIDREKFRSLLKESGYNNVPTQHQFKDDVLAAQWYWDIINFRRMNFNHINEFRGQIRCFDFVISADGFSFSASFTRPCFEEQGDMRPQEINDHPGDVTWFVDPGRSKTFTAMKGISIIV